MADFQQGRINLLDRLKRRVNKYRDHSTISKCHFENTADSIYGDQHKQTLLLKQRHIESKVKKNNKKSDKKLDSSSLLANMGQSKLLARGHDQASGSGEGQDNNEPAAKKQRIANGSMVTSVSADIADFQIVQQLHNIKSRSSPNASTSNTTVTTTNNITTSSLTCSDPLEALSDAVLGTTEGDDSIKKENDLDIPNDSLLEDFGELSNFEDIDMGINLEDFVHDLDLDNIKHENSNPGMDPFFKEEIVDNLFDDPSNISTDSGVVNGSSNGQLGNQSKVSSSTASPVYPPYSNTPPASLCSTATSFSSSSFSSSLPSQPFNSIATSSLSTPFTMTSDLAKMRVNASNNMTMGQNDMVLAAQTLKQMAEQHQTKLSPTGNVVRNAMGEFSSYNSLGGNSMMTQSPSVMTQSSSMMPQSTSMPSQVHNSSINQMSPLYNQSLGNDMEMKRRQQMMQQYSMQQQMQHQSNVGHCNPVVGNQSHPQSMQQSQPQQQQQQQPKQIQHQSQIQSQPSQALQVQNQQLHQQTHQSPTHLSQQVPQIQQHTAQLSQQTAQHLQQTQQQQQQQQIPQAQQQQGSQVSSQQQQSQLQQQTQQQSQLQHQTQQQTQNQVQQASQQSQMRNSLSPFSNRMSPMSSYSHSQQSPNQMGMSPQYANSICSGMTGTSIRAAYPTPTRGSSPIPQVPQNQPSNMSVPTANQPRYMQQQMMGSVGMMRPQMMPQSSQIIARGPPPEYRHPVMMQQHQAMMGQSMSQSMPQLHQGMGQMTYQGMRPGYRPTMSGSPLGTMSGSPLGTMSSGQMMGGMNQQSIPANIPNMKGSMVQGSGMSIPVTGGAMGQGSVCPSGPMSGNGMSVSMNQVTGGASMGMVAARPTMMQRTRPPNVNMGMPGLGMSTQMPPSRPEWRQIMMQQNQSGMMMGQGIRHGYQQVQQGGTMIAQGGQMMPMQRSQAHMMNMMGMQSSPGMQHAAGMGSTGHPMPGNGTMPTHNSQSMQQSMALGGRMQQHSLPSMGQGQVHLGMQMNQQTMQDSRSTTSMSQPQHGGSPSSMSQMGGSPSATLVHHGNPIGHSGMSPMNSGGGVNPNLNHMSSTNISSLAQQVSGNSTTVNVLAGNASSISGITAHPRSPATLGQMHPCSPASSGAGGGPQRPLSNPSIGIGAQGQSSDSSQAVSGNCSPLLVCSSSSGILSTQTQGRQTVVGSNLVSIRTTNPNHGSQSLGPNLGSQSLGSILSSQVTGQQGQSLNTSGNNLTNTQSVMMGNKNSVNGGAPTVQRPESRGGGGTNSKTEPPVSNPPSNSGSNDFDLMFNEGEFAALLN